MVRSMGTRIRMADDSDGKGQQMTRPMEEGDGAELPFLFSEHNGVLEVTLNRPERLNAFDADMRSQLKDLWISRQDDPALRCVIITGSGRAFSAGADVGDMAAGEYAEGASYAAGLDFLPGEFLSVPVIAAVNGLCAGGGLHFVADADLVLAADTAWFNDPHVSVGQVSGLEPVTLLGRVGWSEIARLVLLGRELRIHAAEALRIGLVNEVVVPEQLMERAREMARTIAAQSPEAVRRSLGILRRARRSAVEADLQSAWSEILEHRKHPDATEGSLAFAERRQPRWTVNDKL
ncbi:enoyl-CoA hydratase/isomerase family protein [Arthrobacter sp. W4I7]|uniref:enoyl-CoA hydratase/isomerase family protein n=1 Tax=Arthrobacter sp. W4I7 TaxID=3042296 RepID=UPI00277D6F57|nr:enoyl-CoA hydratase/isomerase family protein [Arthrobacter sp. W4I7]MDQ0691387.1 enoyl-CoA hydratase/carnithine racemase [Arthrobacter sp. W4I7]